MMMMRDQDPVRPPVTGERGRIERLAMLAPAVAAAVLLGASVHGQTAYEAEPILYGKAPARNAISRLQAEVESGEKELPFHSRRGYLDAVLELLDIPVSSQVLVFSKTSLQQKLISPRSPRAVFFREDVYIGWVRGGEVLEISAVDADQGTVFYTLRQERAAAPRFERHHHACTQCHGSTLTDGIPGHVLRSVYSAPDGFPVLHAGTFRTDQRSPIEERWGGWYVTGTHGHQRHMGNVFLRDPAHPEALDREGGANITDLTGLFETSDYPTAHSDIVALLVLEHQAVLQNLMVRASFDTRIALHQQEEMNRLLGREEGALSDSARRRIAQAAESLLEYMLFCGEAALTAPIRGTSGFAEEFVARGRRDREGRSLRDLDLERRLFRHPLSYLVYSESFRALPAPLLERVLERLEAILTGEAKDAKFSHLSPADRRAILEILRDTAPEITKRWNVEEEKSRARL